MASTRLAGALKPAALTVINPSGQRSRVVVNDSPFLIGRQADNHLVLRDNRVSRVHARIVKDGGEYYIEDVNSRHGIFLNGRRIAAREKLAQSDTVTYGFPDGYQLVFLLEDTEIVRLAEQVAGTTRASGPGANLAKLRAVVEVARALQGSLSIQEVLESVVDAALAVTGTQRGFLMLKSQGELEVQVARESGGAALAADDLKVPTRLIRRALDDRRELLSMHFDPHTAGASEPDLSVANLELRSVVCVPLVRVRTELSPETMHASLNETAGLIYLDSRVDLADLSAGNRELLQTLALEASTVLENARLLEQERAKQRLEEELRIARAIQQGLLPRTLPSTGWFRAAASSIASHQVGGDYYDVAPSGPDCWALAVADVSGKGVSSALLASLLQGAFLLGASDPAQIREMLARINRYLYERAEGEKYATLFYAAVHADGTMHWSNAGHCKPLVVSATGELKTLETTGMPVGMLDVAEFGVETTRLTPGAKVVIYSDGLSEAQNLDGDFFEAGRIRQAVVEGAGLGCTELHASLIGQVEQFTGGSVQSDDMTLVVVEYVPKKGQLA